MKSSYVFRDQVGIIGTWFSSWNECEQVVALYALLRKIRKSQVKFLSQVLSQILVNSMENITDNEVEANDPGLFNIYLVHVSLYRRTYLNNHFRSYSL